MTRALAYTQASVRRRIEAAKKAGLRVTGIAADGTVLTVENTPLHHSPSNISDLDGSFYNRCKTDFPIPFAVRPYEAAPGASQPKIVGLLVLYPFLEDDGFRKDRRRRDLG